MRSELCLRYDNRSTVQEDAIALATSDPQVFFDGFAEHPRVAAHGLLCVVQVAATRFNVPRNLSPARRQAGSGRVLSRSPVDPVVTSEPGRLRFESFSQCCGVHARLDLLPDGIDTRSSSPGTTNVDFSADVCDALARVSRRDPLRLTVGAEAVNVHTMQTSVTEVRVPLPDRWIHGFGEVQAPSVATEPILRLDAHATRHFLGSLPRGTAGQLTYWTARSGPNIRLIPRATEGGACLAGPRRLGAFKPLAAHARSLTAYGNPGNTEPATVIWVLEIPGGRVSLALSPDWKRGFTGEGNVLLDLAAPTVREDAQRLRDHLAGAVRFSPREAASSATLSELRARSALTFLGMHGELGFDVAEHVHFWRRLPFPRDILDTEPARLRDARALLAAGAVHPLSDHAVRVQSGDGDYRAQLSADGFRCTCPWTARHGRSRGPCKHVIAAFLQTSRAEGPAQRAGD
jgi:hypothetical protein